MPAISLKGQTMPESPIRKLAPFAEAAKYQGKEVYHLNIGQPDIKTPPRALEAVRNAELDILAYSPSDGFASYKEKLAAYYAHHDIEIASEDLMVTTGGSEALLFALNSITDPGDEVIIPEPFYANYNGFGISAGVSVVPVTARIEEEFALPPIEDFEALIGPNTRAIMICNPGNPTGYLYSLEELEKLRKICLQHDIYLIADEVYREFAYDGARHYSILTLEGLEEHAIVVDSVSKRYSMCGARIGCLISRNSALMATALKYAQARLSPPTLAQIAAEAALTTPEPYYEEVQKEYRERRDILIDGLAEMEGVYCPRPKGAFYAVAQLPVDSAERFAQWLLSAFEVDGKTIMVAPAEGFYATPGMGGNQVRLAYVLEKPKLKESVAILQQALETYPGTHY
ncbi:MAG: pyridoxal phosphate-dependent aminotransferase [Schleiferiaceae bacterium]|nr:pyridoxal phosphate-dependent aminotransferase [Schleiferiaceae bacterium]MDR9442812.1 pyridoxal phosphate-dependent aminotransferase [Schleiferiaceae bacterium]